MKLQDKVAERDRVIDLMKVEVMKYRLDVNINKLLTIKQKVPELE
jgi:hypothetical protein